MEEITQLSVINAPYGKQITINRVDYDNGFSVIRLRIKEGKRFTDIDLDSNTVNTLSEHFSQWLES